MSYYNHMHDSVEHKEVCSECGKNFTWTDDGNTGGRDKELIKCPIADEMKIE